MTKAAIYFGAQRPMRALVIYPISTDFAGNSGIIKKMYQQLDGFRELGFEASIAHNSIAGVIVDGNCRHAYSRQGRGWNSLNHYNLFWLGIAKVICPTELDLIYLRYPGSSPALLAFLRWATTANPRLRVVVEVATYPFRKEMKTPSQKVILAFDDVCSPLLRRYVDRIVTFRDQEEIYGIPCIRTGNGISVATHPLRQRQHHDEDCLRLLGVANVSHWHGYDRVLMGIAEMPEREQRKVFFHLAGNGETLKSLKEIAMTKGIEDRVRFHGHITGKELDALYDECDIAVGSLGLHRIDLNSASTLKLREYCARGIPFVYTGSDHDFKSNWPYALRVPASEAPLDVASVRRFATELSLDDAALEMRNYAVLNLSWSSKLREVARYV